MKLKLKMMAVAAAMASLAGAAHADLTVPGTTNGSFALVAWNTVTRDWYIRDLGYVMNDFLPTGVNASAADGGPATGDKSTPDLKIAGVAGPGVTVKSNFSDSSFSTWYNAQPATDVRWFAGSYDSTSASSSGTTRRAIFASANPLETINNGQIDLFVSSANFGGLSSFYATGGLSKTGVNLLPSADTGFGSGVDVLTVGQSANLFFAARTTFTGASSTTAPVNNFGGGMLTLLSSGELSYEVPSASAVPLPAAVWMMGAGLVAIGGMVRRRRAAAADQA
jgi:hypothetical protein